jgi:hypothetical protein
MTYRPSRFAFFLILVVLITGIYLVVLDYRNKPSEANPAEVHYHAAFAVYRDGVKVDFSGTQFMRIEPCTERGVAHSPEEELAERAHLHDGNGAVVHVHRQDVAWKVLFENIKYDLPEYTKGYIDGTIVDEVLKQPIVPYERIILFTGSLESVAAKYDALPDRSAIEQVEAQSESCGN